VAVAEEVHPDDLLGRRGGRQTGAVEQAVDRPVDVRHRRLDLGGVAEVADAEPCDRAGTRLEVDGLDDGAELTEDLSRRLAHP
jgi:hypothetical protein